MQSEDSAAQSGSLVDERGAARGRGRLIVILFWMAGLAVVAVATYDLVAEAAQPVGPKMLTLFSGLVYLAAALGLTHNGRRMRMVAGAALAVALAGPIIVGLFELGAAQKSAVWSPWTDFGARLYFAPLVLPVVGMVWMWWSNPGRITRMAEGLARPSR